MASVAKILSLTQFGGFDPDWKWQPGANEAVRTRFSSVFLTTHLERVLTPDCNPPTFELLAVCRVFRLRHTPVCCAPCPRRLRPFFGSPTRRTSRSRSQRSRSVEFLSRLPGSSRVRIGRKVLASALSKVLSPYDAGSPLPSWNTSGPDELNSAIEVAGRVVRCFSTMSDS